jgi:hypothetical protein
VSTTAWGSRQRKPRRSGARRRGRDFSASRAVPGAGQCRRSVHTAERGRRPATGVGRQAENRHTTRSDAMESFDLGAARTRAIVTTPKQQLCAFRSQVGSPLVRGASGGPQIPEDDASVYRLRTCLGRPSFTACKTIHSGTERSTPPPWRRDLGAARGLVCIVCSTARRSTRRHLAEEPWLRGRRPSRSSTMPQRPPSGRAGSGVPNSVQSRRSSKQSRRCWIVPIQRSVPTSSSTELSSTRRG